MLPRHGFTQATAPLYPGPIDVLMVYRRLAGGRVPRGLAVASSSG